MIILKNKINWKICEFLTGSTRRFKLLSLYKLFKFLMNLHSQSMILIDFIILQSFWNTILSCPIDLTMIFPCRIPLLIIVGSNWITKDKVILRLTIKGIFSRTENNNAWFLEANLKSSLNTDSHLSFGVESRNDDYCDQATWRITNTRFN